MKTTFRPKNGLRILHLEDSRRDAELTRATLEREGLDCEIVHVKKREEFESAVAQQAFDLILSDYSLPNYNGFSALDFARGNAPDIPFILLSGTLGEELAVESLKTGATDYILKGRLQRLAPAVSRALQEAEERAKRKRAERALEATRRHNELILQSTGEGIFGLDVEGKATFVNRAAAEKLGFRPEELIGQRMHALVHHTRNGGGPYGEQDSPVYAGYKRGAAHHVDNEVFWRKDGTSFPVEYVSNPIRNESGDLVGAVVTFRDITERKEAEQALRRRARTAHLGAEVGLALTQKSSLREILQRCVEAVVTHLDAAFARIWTLSEKEPVLELQVSAGMYTHIDGGHARVPVGKFKIGLIAHERKPHLTNSVIGDARVPEQEWAKREGLVAFAGYPLIVEDRLIGVIAMFARQTLSEDTLEGLKSVADAIALGIVRKRTEEALRESEARFRQLANSIDDVFWIMTADMSEVLYVSPAYSQIRGQPVEDLYHHPRQWIDGITEEDRKSVIDGLKSLGNGMRKLNLEYRVRRPDGTMRWVSDQGFPIQDHSGKVYRIAGVAKDITDRKHAEEENRHLENQLRQVQKLEAIGTLAGGIAHDFNNILGAMIGYTELVKEDIAGEHRGSRHLEEVLKAGQRAKELVQQILAFSRQSAPERKPVAIGMIVREALKLLRATLPSTIQIRTDLKTKSDRVIADPVQIHQILMNLCTNAAHAMRDKGGTLTVSLSEIAGSLAATSTGQMPGPHLRLAVADTGHGMAKAVMDRIFDPFFTTKPVGEGTGLGLSVVHGIVTSHGGRISVSSEPGVGTTFEILLPQTMEAARMVQDVGVPPAGGSERILLVDDEEPLANLLRERLERYGYKVVSETDSAAAFDLFRAAPGSFDVIITDQTMPRFTGIELAKKVREIRPEMPVFICTGYSESVNKEDLKSVAGCEVVLKPVDMRALNEAMRRLLDENKAVAC